MTDLEIYRNNEIEQAREADLMKRAGTGEAALDVGALDGHYSRLLSKRYKRVVALDLSAPNVEGCENVAGDATNLQFPDNTFDLVFCAEVLEHIPAVEKAARELARVSRHRVLIGVPYKQDTRVGRTSCTDCGHIGPPWGHVNEFDDRRIRELFPGLKIESIGYVGENKEHTNALATWLMDQGGNPWGVYGYQCTKCGSTLKTPPRGSFLQRAMSGMAVRMNMLQAHLTKPHGNWIHVSFVKNS